MPNKKSSKTTNPYSYLSLGIEFICVFLFFPFLTYLYITYLAEKNTDSTIAILLSVFLGFIFSTYYLYRRALEINEANSNEIQKKKEYKESINVENLSQEIDQLSKKIKNKINEHQNLILLFSFFLSYSFFTLFLEASPQRKHILIELFTSQGCSSCPPADKVLKELGNLGRVSKSKIIILGEHVDYWNYLGWKDIFSSKIFSQRQKKYAEWFKRKNVYTPQMIVDGRYEFVGHQKSKALKAISLASQKKVDASLFLKNTIKKNKLRTFIKLKKIKNLIFDHSSLYFIIAEKNLKTKIRKGENKGKVLHYASVVRYMKKIDSFSTFSLPKEKVWKKEIPLLKYWDREKLMYVAFLQSENDGHIMGIGVQ